MWHRRAVELLTIVADATWLYVPVAIVSGLFRLGESGVSLPLAVITTGGAFGTARWVSSLPIPLAPARVVNAFLALLTLYIVVGFEAREGFVVFRAGWPVELLQAVPDVRRLLFAAFGTLAFWASGTRLGLAAIPENNLPFIFRIGIPVCVVGVLATVFMAEDLALIPAIYVFFSASLAGFALSHVRESQPVSWRGTWGRLMIASLLVVVGGSLFFVLLSTSVIGEGIALIFGLLFAVARQVILLLALGAGYLA